MVILDTEKEFEKYNENRINSACSWNISYVIYQIKVLIYMWPDFFVKQIEYNKRCYNKILRKITTF